MKTTGHNSLRLRSGRLAGAFFMRPAACIIACFMHKSGCILCKNRLFYTLHYAKSYMLYARDLGIQYVVFVLFAKLMFNA